MNWKNLIQYSSVQLRKIDKKGMPCGIGSGCLFDFNNHRLLLTVFHVAEKSADWCAQIKFNEDVQQIEVLFLNQFSYIGYIDSENNSIKDVEFSFHPVRPDFKCYFHNRNSQGQTIELLERPVLKIDDIGEPQKNIYYGFSGDIMPALIPDQNAFVTDYRIYHGLQYDRYENGMHFFRMPEKHPGHEWFKGCSGAPIIGEDGKVVSLVSGGCMERNEIYGNNLSKCIRTLDVFLD